MDRPATPTTPPVVHFLHDQAATEDAFGPHERIAGLVARAICTDPNIRIVGLLGPRGSGKSTVVGFVQMALAAQKNVSYEVFTFDAWLNQGDSPRRAFLEALVRHVSDERLTPDKDWSEQLHRVTGRLDVTQTVDTPLNSALAIVVRLAVPVTVVGAGLLAKATDLGVLLAGSASAGTYLACALTLALPAAAALYYVASRPTWRFWTSSFYALANWTTRAKRYRNESLTSLVLLKTDTRRENRVYLDPTPSSIEFQDIVHEILARLAANKKRLLVVIDNLDRLPEDEALGLWAVIRTFFLGERRPNPDEANETATHATILLPIEEKAVELLYSQSSKAD